MQATIEKDPEGNPFFRQVRIPLGAGSSTTVRVIDAEAQEVAEKIMTMDLGPSISAVEASGQKFKSEYDFRVAVSEHAVDVIRKDGRSEMMKNAPMYHPDSMSA